MYELYKDRVFNVAISYLKNEPEAEEITQDVFVTIFQKAYQFQGKSKVSTWIYRITVNKSLNQLQINERLATSRLESKIEKEVDFVHPGVLLENKELSTYLFKAIDTLKEQQKTAFILSYIEDLPRQEVADIMNTTLKSVESLLQRAKSNLRKEIIMMYPEGKEKK